MSKMYENATQVRSHIWTNNQMSTITRSFLIAGIGFLLVCGIGAGFGYLIWTGLNEWGWRDFYDLINGLWAATFILILVSMVLSIFWAIKINTASKGFVYMCFGIYILAQGMGFGFLFGLVEIPSLIVIFGISAALFLGMALVGFLMKDKTAMTFRKIMMMVSMVVMGLMLVMGLMWVFAWLFGWYSPMFDWWFYLTILLAAVMMLLYTAWDVYKIQKSSVFLDLASDKVRFNHTMFFGYKLLSDLITIIWYVAIFVIRFGGKR